MLPDGKESVIRELKQKGNVIMVGYGVKKAEVSHKTGTAVVTLEKEISDDVLKKTVSDQGYQVTDIQ